MSKEKELLERALDHLCDMNSSEDCLLKKEIRAYLAEPEVKREALSDDEVDSLFTCDETSPEYEHGFRDGIWFAEKHHGIGGDDGNNK